jgi:hypothetical protein
MACIFCALRRPNNDDAVQPRRLDSSDQTPQVASEVACENLASAGFSNELPQAESPVAAVNRQAEGPVAAVDRQAESPVAAAAVDSRTESRQMESPVATAARQVLDLDPDNMKVVDLRMALASLNAPGIAKLRKGELREKLKGAQHVLRLLASGN